MGNRVESPYRTGGATRAWKGVDPYPGNTNEGFADWITGSVDESIARQFDARSGGGFADETLKVTNPNRAASEQTEKDIRSGRVPVAGMFTPAVQGFLAARDTADAVTPNKSPPQGSYPDQADEAAGKTDESIARQFDNTPGGGFADETIKTINENIKKPAFNFGPGWLDEAAIGGLVLAGLLVVVYILGTLFDIGVNQ